MAVDKMLSNEQIAELIKEGALVSLPIDGYNAYGYSNSLNLFEGGYSTDGYILKDGEVFFATFFESKLWRYTKDEDDHFQDVSELRSMTDFMDTMDDIM